MNHPIIANNNGQARYNELLQEAANHRLETKVTKPNSRIKIVNLIINLFG